MDALGPYYTLIATNKMELKTLQKIPETQMIINSFFTVSSHGTNVRYKITCVCKTKKKKKTVQESDHCYLLSPGSRPMGSWKRHALPMFCALPPTYTCHTVSTQFFALKNLVCGSYSKETILPPSYTLCLNISFFRNLLKTISLVKLIHHSNLYALNSVLLQTRDKLALVSLVHCTTNRFSNFYLKQQGHLAQGKWSRPAPCYPGKSVHMEAVPKKH